MHSLQVLHTIQLFRHDCPITAVLLTIYLLISKNVRFADILNNEISDHQVITLNILNYFTTSLVPNHNKTVRYGKRLIDTSTAALWNSLQNNIKCARNIRHFKKLVKLYMST